LGVKFVEINLERHSELNAQFQSYQLDEILFSVSLITGETIKPDSSVILFLDEAQATPAAYSCLRYFYEDMPNLAVILTGSLLDQVLQNYHFLKYQVELLQTYRDDFAKYSGSQNATLLNAYFNGILGQIGRQFSHKQVSRRK